MCKIFAHSKDWLFTLESRVIDVSSLANGMARQGVNRKSPTKTKRSRFVTWEVIFIHSGSYKWYYETKLKDGREGRKWRGRGTRSLTLFPHMHTRLPGRTHPPSPPPCHKCEHSAVMYGIVASIRLLLHRVCPLFEESLVGELLLRGLFRLLTKQGIKIYRNKLAKDWSW